MYCHFHKGHDHTTNEFIQLEDVIKSMINKGWLFEYTKEGKWDREESLEHKSPSKFVDVMASGEGTSNSEKEASKGKLKLQSYSIPF